MRIYRIVRKLYMRGLMPKKIWFLVYDKYHKFADDLWVGERQ